MSLLGTSAMPPRTRASLPAVEQCFYYSVFFPDCQSFFGQKRKNLLPERLSFDEGRKMMSKSLSKAFVCGTINKKGGKAILNIWHDILRQADFRREFRGAHRDPQGLQGKVRTGQGDGAFEARPRLIYLHGVSPPITDLFPARWRRTTTLWMSWCSRARASIP